MQDDLTLTIEGALRQEIAGVLWARAARLEILALRRPEARRHAGLLHKAMALKAVALKVQPQPFRDAPR